MILKSILICKRQNTFT